LTRLLVEHGADIEAAPTGATPFHLAVSSGCLELVEALIELGADPCALIAADSGKSETALHMAVAAWKDELLPRLLAAGLNVNAAGQKPAGQTPLHIAAWYGYDSAAQTLLDAGADVNARYADGLTPLHKAAQHDHVNMCELLLARGADLMSVAPQRGTPLTIAAIHGKKRATHFLLDKCLTLMTPNQKAELMISAAGAGQREILDRLLDNNFDPNLTDNGFSPLDAAAHSSHETIVIFLLKRGANPGIYDTHPWRSSRMAGEKDRDRIVGILEGTIPTEYPVDPNTPTHVFDPVSVAWALALDKTWASKRRIMANPNPGGFPARCSTCQDLDFRRGVPKDAEVIHWVYKPGFAESAEYGCPGCNMILHCLKQLASVYGEHVEDWKQATSTAQLVSEVHGGPLYVSYGTGLLQGQGNIRAEIYSKPRSPVTWPSVGRARDVEAAPWSDERKKLIHKFLEECLTKHQSCYYEDSVLPTRVIDVGSDTSEPNLYITNGEVGRYVTLSHCWGGSSPVTTTTTNLESHKAVIPYKGLPKTFRDAVTITRELGVRFLWIDSLCILQDSREDWETEALNMSAVYENGYVMIAAEASENCHGGCFPVTTPASQTFSTSVDGPGGRPSKVHFRLSTVLSDDRGEVCHNLYSTEKGFRRNALDRRGWTLQERILAPRTLHFGKSEVGWECAGHRTCECQTVRTQTDTDSRFKAQLVNFGWKRTSAAKTSNASADEHRWMWSNIIQEFTRRSLTVSRDLLPALSGMAQRMSLTAEDDYVCGIWKQKLRAFLFWKPDYQFIQAHALREIPRRHRDGYYAPSWSWASVVAPVVYSELGGQPSGLRGGNIWTNPYPINKGEAAMEPENYSSIKILDIQAIPAGRNPFGPVKSASLTVCGFSAPAYLHGKKKDQPNNSSGNGGLLVSTAVGVESARADFEPDVLDANEEVVVEDKVFLL
ncbi:hypothetical protein GQ53DRAFT_626098, partial [Thozetella sp. PMI_491]